MKKQLLIIVLLIVQIFNAKAQTYCAAANTDCNFEHIINVKLSNLDYTSTCGDPYDDYTALAATCNITIGTNYSGTATKNLVSGIPGNFPNYQLSVFIDWNQNFIFDTDEVTVATASGQQGFTYTIIPPAAAKIGITRMRVRMIQNGNPTACGNALRGDVEDYSVNVKAAGVPQKAKARFTKNDSTICVGGTVRFTSSSSNADSVRWTFEGGNPATSKSNGPSVIYSTEGVYDVKLVAYSAGGNDTLTLTDDIDVSPNPVATFTLPDTACANEDIDIIFTGSAPAGSEYIWDFGSGAMPASSSTAGNQKVKYTAASKPVITLVIINSNGCTTTYKDSLIIKICSASTKPVAAFGASKLFTCINTGINYNNASTNAKTYLWTFEGGNPASSTDTNPSVLYNSAGTYDVTLIAYSGNESDTLVKENYVTVDPLPNASFTAAEVGCKDSTVLVNFTGSAAGNATFNWDFGVDAFPATSNSPGNQTTVYSTIGQKIITLQIIQNSCISEVYYDTIIIEDCMIVPGDTAVSDFTFLVEDALRKVTFTNTSKKSNSYKWDFGDGSISTDANPTYTYTSNGNYDVCLISYNATTSDTICKVVVINKQIVGVRNALMNKIKIYPNPSQGIVYIENLNGDKIEKISVLQSDGKLIYINSLTNQLDLSNINSGLNFINFYTTKGIISQKIEIIK